MITEKMTRELIGRHAYDAHGEKIGKIGQVYLDEQSGRPTWATVNTGLFGMKESFVPLDGADAGGDNVTLGVSKDKVKEAPHVGQTAERLTGREEQELRRHYQVGDSRQDTAAREGMHEGTDRRRSDRGADDAMVRHEERLQVGTQSEEAGTVRLRKYVVTEDQTVTVPVSHEEVRLEREPITDGTSARPGAIGEETAEVTLHRERPVVNKTTEAVEKVRLDTRTVTEEQTVSDSVRKEQIEVDDPQHRMGKGHKDGKDSRGER